ncbi:hypothetical protein B0H17DRAFT_1325706 [Mycena rosella]|uniref:Uncharacterized protein n=1 Tax=Mycena rosella TaxID=1033263 RepID=A0AAD7M9U6_MYCRO|nr:hypothetical protein B0H17DRAFT_1325706 [Mycena rosella]
MARPRLLALSLAALLLHYVAAETSLVVPLNDPQPISADVLGVDSALDRTTWVLHQGALTGTWSDQESNFPGTATLVEGTDYASLTYAAAVQEITLAAGAECAIADGLAVCVVVEDGTTSTETDPAQPFGIQGGATVAGQAAPTLGPVSGSGSGSGAPSNTQASAGSGSGSGSGPGTSGTGAPSNTQPSSFVRVRASLVLGALVGLLAVCLLA